MVVASLALLIPRIMAFTSIGIGGVVVTVVALILSTTDCRRPGCRDR